MARLQAVLVFLCWFESPVSSFNTPISLRRPAIQARSLRPMPDQKAILQTHSGVRMSATSPSPSPSKQEKQSFSPYGAFMVFSTLCIGALFSIPMFLWKTVFGSLDPERNVISKLGNFWGRVSIWVAGGSCTVIGRENFPPEDVPCMVLVNHASQLDIPATGFLGRSMKYIAKAELAKYPIIGWKMQMAEDILIERSSRASQSKLLRAVIKKFKKGSSVLAFPEGTRSVDGKLKTMKRGPFKMAMMAKVPIVPVTLKGTHECWPAKSPLLQRRPRLKVVIHPPLDAKAMEEEELLEKTVAAMQAGLDMD